MLRGVALKIFSTLCFAAMGALAKSMSASFSVAELVFFRSALALVTVVVWLRLLGEFPRAIHTDNPFGHVLRGIAGVGGMGGFFVGLSMLPLPDATALSYATPLLVVVLAALLLKENVQPYRWAAVAIGFVGVIVMMSEHLSGGSAAGATASLIGAACASLAAIQTRRLTRYEKTGAIVFYFSALTTAVSLAFLIAAHFWPGEGWLAAQKWSWPAPGVLALLCGIGVFGGIGQITLTESYRYAEASVISPLEYVSMLWAATFGYVFFGDAPSIRILIGAAIVAGAGLYLIFRERKAEAR